MDDQIFILFEFQTPWLFLESLCDRRLQCERDFRPFSIRRSSTSMPPFELSLLIQPWVLLRLMFLGWYSVPLFLVRTCWYCHAGCWKTTQPSACEEIGPNLEIRGCPTDLGRIQLLNCLRWEAPVRFPNEVLLKDHWLELLFVYFSTLLQEITTLTSIWTIKTRCSFDSNNTTTWAAWVLSILPQIQKFSTLTEVCLQVYDKCIIVEEYTHSINAAAMEARCTLAALLTSSNASNTVTIQMLFSMWIKST